MFSNPIKRWVAGGTAVACAWVAAGSPADATAVELANSRTYSFSVSGTSMSDLYPGAVRRTQVTVSNPYSFPIKVQRIDARVAETSKRRCEPIQANLMIGSYQGSLPLIVRAHGRRPVGEFRVRMPNTVANACQNATFRLTFTAKATRADR